MQKIFSLYLPTSQKCEELSWLHKKLLQNYQMPERFTSERGFLYFSKAFDTDPQSILLNKLSNCGMSSLMVCWPGLNNKAQRFVMGEAPAGRWLILSGVLQSSVLGTALFLLMKDLNAPCSGRSWGVALLFSATAWGEGGELEMLSSASCDPQIGHTCIAQSCGRGGLDWILGSISILRGWSNLGSGLIERLLMLQTCQC